MNNIILSNININHNYTSTAGFLYVTGRDVLNVLLVTKPKNTFPLKCNTILYQPLSPSEN